jgi:DNA-binding MarR family transcriptional regulator
MPAGWSESLTRGNPCGFVARKGDEDDRQTYALEITPKGRETLEAFGMIS